MQPHRVAQSVHEVGSTVSGREHMAVDVLPTWSISRAEVEPRKASRYYGTRVLGEPANGCAVAQVRRIGVPGRTKTPRIAACVRFIRREQPERARPLLRLLNVSR